MKMSLLKTILCSLVAVLPFVAMQGRARPQTGGAQAAAPSRTEKLELLKEVLELVAAEHPTLGVCLIADTDTICINEKEDFAMMSVVKLFQAVAISRILDENNETLSLDVKVTRDDLPTNTWSPLAKENRPDEFWMTMREMFEYTLRKSDNNVCDLLFEMICIPKDTEKKIRELNLPGRFGIEVTESDQVEWPPCDVLNYCSPKAAAALIDRIFNGRVASRDAQGTLQVLLAGVETGEDKIMKPLEGTGAIVAHKTGTGWDKDGFVTASNDVAHVILPSGESYSLAVLVANFEGSMEQANALIAKVSEIVYKTMTQLDDAEEVLD